MDCELIGYARVFMVGAIFFAQFCVGSNIFNANLNSVNVGMVLGFLLCSLTIFM